MNIPDKLFYTKEHEWVRIEGSLATAGITDYAQSSLGDITFVELPKVDTPVEQFKQLATIESVKAASDVYAPVSGRVVRINEQLNESPGIINQSSYKEGWLVVIEIRDEKEKENLLSPQQYGEYLKGLSE